MCDRLSNGRNRETEIDVESISGLRHKDFAAYTHAEFAEARRLIHPDQAIFLDRLLEHLHSQGEANTLGP